MQKKMRTNDRQSWKHRAKNQQKWAWTITWRSDQTIWRNKKDLTRGRIDHYSATKSTKPENSRRCYLFTAWNLGPCLWLVGLLPCEVHRRARTAEKFSFILWLITLSLRSDLDTVKMNLLSRIATCSKKSGLLLPLWRGLCVFFVYVCSLITTVSCAKTPEPIEMVAWTRVN